MLTVAKSTQKHITDRHTAQTNAEIMHEKKKGENTTINTTRKTKGKSTILI